MMWVVPVGDLTHDQHVLLNTWSQLGATHFLRKVKSGWIIDTASYPAAGSGHPGVFKRKRDAIDACDQMILAMARRWRGV